MIVFLKLSIGLLYELVVFFLDLEWLKRFKDVVNVYSNIIYNIKY